MERDQHENAFIHFLLPLLLSTHWLRWSLSQRPWGHTGLSHRDKQATARTYGQLRVPPNHLAFIFLECGRKPESPEENPQTQGTALQTAHGRSPQETPRDPTHNLPAVCDPPPCRPTFATQGRFFLQPLTSEPKKDIIHLKKPKK